MDSEDNVMVSHEERRTTKDQQVDNAIRAIQQKKPLPEIDFTIHTMEDGTQVSTMERVCKGMPRRCTRPPALPSGGVDVRG
jgi:serine/threonine-protein phosphatase 2B catalytic subunit